MPEPMLDLEQAIILAFVTSKSESLSTSQVIAALHAANPRVNSGKVIDTLYEMLDEGKVVKSPTLKNKWSLVEGNDLFPLTPTQL